MDDLRRFFRDSMRHQLAAIERMLPAVRSREASPIAEIRRLAHSLKGAGASYGFPGVSDAAARAVAAGEPELTAAVEQLASSLRDVVGIDHTPMVLHVEDDPLITHLVRIGLQAAGHRVVVVETVAAAREVLALETPSIVLLDLILPDGDGRTLLKEMRAAEATTTTPVIVVSGTSGSATRIECETLGADSFIAKPFEPEALFQTVEQMLRPETATTESDRSDLLAAYRQLTREQQPISVAAVIPETHGAHSDGVTDLDHVSAVLAETLGSEGVFARWEEDEIVVVMGGEGDELAGALDRARMVMRNRVRVGGEGAMASISAAVVHDAGNLGLLDMYARAHRFALDARQQGGDRVVRARQTPARSNRVLIIEDDTLTAALIIHRLEREGVEVVHHADGGTGFDEALTGDFDLIVLDVNLPGMNGFDILERMRARHELAETPIVMLTIAGSEEEVVRGFALGADDYILKPFSPTELVARLGRYIRKAAR